MDNNTKDIFNAIYCLMNLAILEANDQDILVDAIHFCFEIQVNLILLKNKKISIISLVSSNKND